MRLGFAKRVQKDFEKIPKRDAHRILAAVKNLESNPRPAGAKKLKAEELYRIRIGVWVLYEIFDQSLIVTVVRVSHRKDVYRG